MLKNLELFWNYTSPLSSECFIWQSNQPVSSIFYDKLTKYINLCIKSQRVSIYHIFVSQTMPQIIFFFLSQAYQLIQQHTNLCCCIHSGWFAQISRFRGHGCCACIEQRICLTFNNVEFIFWSVQYFLNLFKEIEIDPRFHFTQKLKKKSQMISPCHAKSVRYFA